jgi:hypothetical protein
MAILNYCWLTFTQGQPPLKQHRHLLGHFKFSLFLALALHRSYNFTLRILTGIILFSILLQRTRIGEFIALYSFLIFTLF